MYYNIFVDVVLYDFMEKIIVKLSNASYPITIGSGLFKQFSTFYPLKYGDIVVIITNNRIAPIYLEELNDELNEFGVKTDQLILPDGEQSKSLCILNRIFTKLLTRNCDRDTILIALGGGVIGDLTGFAASIYQRGIRFIQVPTTLLAQVDASIGGKTGINHVLGKNMIGSFYQPVAVVIDLDFLHTLTTKEFSSGLAEIIKYAVAFDSVFFNWLEKNLDDLLKLNSKALMYCVSYCCKLKVSIITQDEKEYGVRSLLNLGHTYAHAIESYLKYSKKWSHGSAVSAGIMLAVSTAVRLGQFNNLNDINRIQTLLERSKLPIQGPKDMKPQDYIKYMERDKKSRLGKINLVLPISIGCSKIFINIDHNLVINSIIDNRSNNI